MSFLVFMPHDFELEENSDVTFKNFFSDLNEIWYIVRDHHNNKWLAGVVDR